MHSGGVLAFPFGGQVVVGIGLDEIRFRAPPLLVHRAGENLRSHNVVLRRPAEPFQGFRVVFLHATPAVIKRPEPMLRLRAIGLRRFTPPFEGLGEILVHPFAQGVHPRQGSLGLHVTSLCFGLGQVELFVQLDLGCLEFLFLDGLLGGLALVGVAPP